MKEISREGLVEMTKKKGSGFQGKTEKNEQPPFLLLHMLFLLRSSAPKSPQYCAGACRPFVAATIPAHHQPSSLVLTSGLGFRGSGFGGEEADEEEEQGDRRGVEQRGRGKEKK